MATVTPQSHRHYHLPVLLYSRMPEPRSPRRALHPPLRRHRLPEAHPLMRQRTRARQRARVRAGDRHILVRHLSRRGRDMLVDFRLEAVLLHGRGGVLDADGGRLQGEGFGLGEGVVLGCELRGIIVVVVGFAVLGEGVGVLQGRGARAVEARGVGRGLGAELGEVEVGAGAVAEIHGFVEAPLGVEAVEDDGVDGDGDDLDGDLDDGADQRPALEAADERVVDVFLEERFARAVLAAPAPHVLRVAAFAGFVEDDGADGPHDGAEDEGTDRKDSVVDGGFFGSSTTAAVVEKDDAKGHGERDAGDAEQGYLRPYLVS